MRKIETIEHEAIIKDVKDDNYEAEILAIASCAACQLKKVCSVSDMKEKMIVVQKEENIERKVGDKITIFIAQSKGLKAVFLGYVLPLIFVMITLISVFLITGKEGMSAIAAISVLVPYYLILYSFKEKIEEKYKFHIKK